MTTNSGTGTSIASYGCVDFANNERTLAYYRWACANDMFPGNCRPTVEALCFCPDDSPEGGYSDPITDNVCWYDSTVSESSEFLGLIVLNHPVSSSTFTREVADGAIEGSILNRPRIKGRSFAFEVLLLATSCEGMNYGKEWLRGLLEDTSCSGRKNNCESCFGRCLSLRVHCPEEGATDTGIHEWMSAGLVDGLTDAIEDAGRRECCCVLQKATFTMQSESPYSFAPSPTTICDKNADPDSFTKCYDWSDCSNCDACPEECTNCDRCRFDPACESLPFLIPDPGLSVTACLDCDPLATVYECCCSEDLPSVYDTTFRIEIYSGFDPSNADLLAYGMRDFKLSIYQNPKGFDCITDDDSYALWTTQEPCVDLHIRYIPYNSTLVIDGRTRRVTLTCDGVCKPFDHVVSSSNGPIFPLISRCTPIMSCAKFSYYNTQFNDVSPAKPTHVKVDSYLRFKN